MSKSTDSTSSLPILEAYKHCPKCGASVDHKVENLLKCSQCGYNYFVNQAPTAGLLILDDQNRVLLAKRKIAPAVGAWQVPGGFLGLDETLEQAAVREALEELAVKVELGGLAGSFPADYDYGGVILPFLGVIFEATIVEGELTAQDDVAELRYFSASELDDLNIAYPNLRAMLNAYMARFS